MFTSKKNSLSIYFFIIISILLTTKASALSSSSYELVLIVIHSQHDTSISFPEIENLEFKKRNALFAEYFTIYPEKSYQNLSIELSNDESSFIVTLDKYLFSAPLTYAVVDFKNEGISSHRSTPLYVFSVIVTVSLTIICDCLILYQLGFHKRKSLSVVITSGIIVYSIMCLWIFKSFPSVFIMAITRGVSEVILIPAKVISSVFLPLEENKKRDKKADYIIASSVAAFVLNLLLFNVLPI